MSGLLGGETEVGEVQEAARAVWDALRTVPDDNDPISARLSLSARMKPSRYTPPKDRLGNDGYMFPAKHASG